MRTLANTLIQGNNKTSDQKVVGSNPSRHAVSSDLSPHVTLKTVEKREHDQADGNVGLVLVVDPGLARLTQRTPASIFHAPLLSRKTRHG